MVPVAPNRQSAIDDWQRHQRDTIQILQTAALAVAYPGEAGRRENRSGQSLLKSAKCWPDQQQPPSRQLPASDATYHASPATSAQHVLRLPDDRLISSGASTHPRGSNSASSAENRARQVNAQSNTILRNSAIKRGTDTIDSIDARDFNRCHPRLAVCIVAQDIPILRLPSA